MAGQVTTLQAAASALAVRLSLYAALLKREAFEWLIQKTTEVGVAEIVPVLTERSVVRPRADRLAAQVGRWNKLAQAAGAQCHAPRVPPVREPLAWEEALARWQGQGCAGLVFTIPGRGEPAAELSGLLTDLPPGDELALFLGPEGDFAPREVEQARAAGLRPAGLGHRILRAETAAVVATALCLYELGRQADL